MGPSQGAAPSSRKTEPDSTLGHPRGKAVVQGVPGLSREAVPAFQAGLQEQLGEPGGSLASPAPPRI